MVVQLLCWVEVLPCAAAGLLPLPLAALPWQKHVAAAGLLEPFEGSWNAHLLLLIHFQTLNCLVGVNKQAECRVCVLCRGQRQVGAVGYSA